MGIFIRILAVVAALWAIFACYKATKNEKQLSDSRIELRASQEKYHDAQARREITSEKENSLRDDIRLKQSEVRSLRKKLEEKRKSDANRELQELKKQERARRAQQEEEQKEEERASRARWEEERAREERERASRAQREEKERARREVRVQERRIESARDRLLNQVTPPYIPSYIPSEKMPKSDFGTIDRLNSAWSATMRGLIKATQKRDRKKIQELVKKLRKTADSADTFLKSAKYTQETEKVIQAVSDILQAIKEIQELQGRRNSP